MIVLDLRGHGKSGDGKISLETFVEDISALLDEIGIKDEEELLKILSINESILR